MRFQISILSTILTATIILTGCPGEPANTNSNSANVAANAPPVNANSPFNTTAKTPEQTANQAPTLTPVVKAYCDAMTRKDEAALRKVYSQATLKYYEAEMKAENSKSLVEYMAAEQVSNSLCEARNEKIEGETGVAEIRTEGAPNGFKVKFVRENGEWKLTNESPDIQSVRQSVSNSNTSK
jgi:type IV secretory pathway VirB10-like protein